MIDKQLSELISKSLSYEAFQGYFKEAYHLIALSFSSSFKEIWSESKILILTLLILFLTIKYWEKGIGSLAYYVIYLIIWGFIFLIFGCDIIFHDWIKLIMLLTHIGTFRLVKYILMECGIWHR